MLIGVVTTERLTADAKREIRATLPAIVARQPLDFIVISSRADIALVDLVVAFHGADYSDYEERILELRKSVFVMGPRAPRPLTRREQRESQQHLFDDALQAVATIAPEVMAGIPVLRR